MNNTYFVIVGYGLINISSVENYNIGNCQLIKFNGTNIKGFVFENKIISTDDVVSVIQEGTPIDPMYLSMYLSQYLTGEEMQLARDLAANL